MRIELVSVGSGRRRKRVPGRGGRVGRRGWVSPYLSVCRFFGSGGIKGKVQTKENDGPSVSLESS